MTTRQADERRALAAAMAAGAAIGRITPSRLMSPADLELATRGRPDLHGRLKGWCLCTEVPADMWERALEAHAKGTANQVMVAEAPSGRRYFVIVVHAKGWQHRICVPLLGDVTAEWLAVLSSRRLITVSVTCAGSDRTFIAELRVPAEALAHLAGLDTRFRCGLVDFLRGGVPARCLERDRCHRGAAGNGAMRDQSLARVAGRGRGAVGAAHRRLGTAQAQLTPSTSSAHRID